MTTKSATDVDILERLFKDALKKADWTKIRRAMEGGKNARLGVSIFVTDRRESSYLAVQYKSVDET